MMKLIATAALLLMVPISVSAQNADHPYRGQGYMVFGLGTSFGMDGSGAARAVKQVSFGGEGFLHKGLGFGAEAGYASWGPQEFNKALIGSADFSYHFGRNAGRGKIDPFVLAGFTVYAPTSHGNRGEPAGNFGGGVNVWVSDHAALRFEVRHHETKGSAFGPPFGPGVHYLSFRVGMTFR